MSNRMANRKLLFDNQHLRSQTFRIQLTKSADKLKTQNNILHKLCSTAWAPSVETLRITTLELVYLVAEYASVVWRHFAKRNHA